MNLFNEKFIAWIILNILIFYGPIEKNIHISYLESECI